jgi:oligosaccharyltransferase complex subunit alpha (ribophorin I)
VPHHSKLTVKNDGKAAVASVTLCLPAALRPESAGARAAWGSFTDDNALAQTSGWATPAGAPAAASCADFALPTPLAPGKSGEVLLRAVFSKALRPLPATIKQGDDHRVVYEELSHTLSPYPILSDAATLELGGTAVSHAAASPSALAPGNKLALGPYVKVAPFSAAPLRVHFKTGASFAEAARVERDVDVSAWGTVYFEDRYWLSNAAAALAGEFSRFALMTAQKAPPGVVVGVVAAVPGDAHALFFRDAIGNVSTSAVHRRGAATVVMLTPRFPLFGGWSTTFKFGWALPLSSVVDLSAGGAGGRVALAFEAGPAVQDVVVEELVLRVVLPEGASDVQVACALPHQVRHERALTYLDVLGRPAAVVTIRDFVPEAGTRVVVSYEPSGMALLQKPALLTAGERAGAARRGCVRVGCCCAASV